MIIVDLNQVIFSTILIQFHKAELSENLLRHMVLNCLRSYKSKFGGEYGELVIAVDSRHYWRRDIFPYYKAHRKRDRESSGLNWELIFKSMDQIKKELREFFPYKYIEVEGAEADDIVAVLARETDEAFGQNEKVLIMSADKDFVQLHTPNIQQYDPIRSRWLKSPDSKLTLIEHIIRGDSGDGIPNIKSPDNVFVIGEKQGKITKKFIDEVIPFADKDMKGTKYESAYMRNKQLIDLNCIPNSIKMEIINQYRNQKSGDRSKLFNYFIKNNLKNLMSNINDF